MLYIIGIQKLNFYQYINHNLILLKIKINHKFVFNRLYSNQRLVEYFRLQLSLFTDFGQYRSKITWRNLDWCSWDLNFRIFDLGCILNLFYQVFTLLFQLWIVDRAWNPLIYLSGLQSDLLFNVSYWSCLSFLFLI